MQKFIEFPLDEFMKEVDPCAFFSQGAIAYAKGKERENGLTIGWGALGVLWRKKVITVYIHKDRFSKRIFDEAETFSVMTFGEGQKELLDYFGTYSGRDIDKAKKRGLNVIQDEAPYFEEAEIAIIAKKIGQSDFDVNHVDDGVRAWYQRSGVHTIYQGEILKVLKKVGE